MPRTFMKLLLILCITSGIVLAGAYATEVRVLLKAGIKPDTASVTAAVRLFRDFSRTWNRDLKFKPATDSIGAGSLKMLETVPAGRGYASKIDGGRR